MYEEKLHDLLVYINNETERITMRRKWMLGRFSSCVLSLCAGCGTAWNKEIMFKALKPEVNFGIDIILRFHTHGKRCVSIINISRVYGDRKMMAGY